MSDTILVGEDDPVQRRMVCMLLTKKLGYKTLEASNGREVMALIDASNIGDINAVLLDISMPGVDGFAALKHIQKYRPDLPVIMLTAEDTTDIAVKAIKAGASDFIVKPAEVLQLDVSLKNAIRLSALARELTRLKRDKEGGLRFHDLVGYGEGLAEAIAYGQKAAASDVPLLITGETSTGKELLARAIHGESRRTGGPFIAINCSAIPQHAIESVLFGHEKGAFAGAAARSIGKFREAERGTVFLDDIHLLPTDAQVKLLRILQQREVEPIGSSKPVKVNVRVISATNYDLKSEVREGRFREDLYFRLNVLTIPIPSLRKRRQDIVPLAEYFIGKICSLDMLPIRPLAADAKHYLTDYSWPGNVRELEGLIHRALVLCEQDAIDRELLIGIHDSGVLPPEQEAEASDMHINIRHASGLFKTMAEVEMQAMLAVLKHYEQNVTRAAEALNIAKSTFYRKIKNL